MEEILLMKYPPGHPHNDFISTGALSLINKKNIESKVKELIFKLNSQLLK